MMKLAANHKIKDISQTLGSFLVVFHRLAIIRVVPSSFSRLVFPGFPSSTTGLALTRHLPVH